MVIKKNLKEHASFFTVLIPICSYFVYLFVYLLCSISILFCACSSSAQNNKHFIRFCWVNEWINNHLSYIYVCLLKSGNRFEKQKCLTLSSLQNFSRIECPFINYQLFHVPIFQNVSKILLELALEPVTFSLHCINSFMSYIKWKFWICTMTHVNIWWNDTAVHLAVTVFIL